MSDQSAPPEIVIVRRRGDGADDAHHGGVWKIAYADFMTAMMTFFLVMWLINAADKKVLTQIATYFNPLKMADRVTAKKGIDDLIEGIQQQGRWKAGGSREDPKKTADTATGEAETGPKAKEAAAAASGQTHMTEQELFNDPYGILEKLAAQAVIGTRGGFDENTGTGQALEGGTAFRDPFDPDFNRRSSSSTALIREQAAETIKAELQARRPTVNEKDSINRSTSEQGTQHNEKETSTGSMSEDGETPSVPDTVDESSDSATGLKGMLEQALEGFSAGQRPAVSVDETPEGLLISLTDEFDFEMFKLSSAEPNPRLVASMKKVGQVLKGMAGRIVIRGHTDGRPFKKGTSDNWRLSVQRALMSRYILIAGGVGEQRIERVEGYADTMLKAASDPLAAQNRRIEILLRK